MANKKKIKRKFLIPGELTWIHVVIFLILCLVFIRETRFAFGNGGIDDGTSNIGNVGSILPAGMLNLVDDSGVGGEENGENFHAAAGGEEDSLTDTTVVGNTRGTKNTEGYTIFDENNETISICDPYGTGCITIMDRNLGAITNDITNTGSYGYHYQWGNNHGFLSCYENSCTEFPGGERNSSSTTSTKGYGSGAFYSGTIFYHGGNGSKDWSLPSNPNLRGGIGDGSGNWYGLMGHNPIERRQGPCPDGFHVPSIGARNKMINYWISIYTGEGNSVYQVKNGFFNSFSSPSDLGIKFQNDFKMGLVGYRSNARDINSIDIQALFWSSSPFNVEENYSAGYCDYHNCYGYDNSYYFAFTADPSSSIKSIGVNRLNREYGLSIRCFKDTSISSNIVNFWIGNEKVGIRNANKIIALDKLKATGYIVKGWHEDGSNDLFDFNTNISEDLDLYAEWECDTNYHEEGGVCVLDSYNINWLNWDNSIIKTDLVEYGNTPWYLGDTPTKPDDECYRYEFRSWLPKIASVTQDASYSAQYNQYNKYFKIVYKDREEEVGQDLAGCWDYWVQDYIEKPGYIFEGWYFDKDLTKRVDSSIYITGDVVLYGKRGSCPEGYTAIDNECISEQAGIFYELGVIRVTDGKTTINVKDRNQGVDFGIKYDDISEFDDLLSTWESCYADLYTQKSKGLNKREVSEDSSNFVCPDESEIYGRLSEISGYPVTSYEDIQNAREYLYRSLYGTYYYRGNNTGAYYEELNVNGEDININEETFMRGFNGGKINGLEQGWINTDDGNSPCDASKGEYLPTAEQWQGLRDLYYNINRSMDNFEQDLLIPQAGNIYYHDSSMDAKKGFKSSLSLRDFFGQAVIAEEIDVFRTISNKYKPYSSLLWLAINENSQNGDDENIGKGIMDNIYAVDRGQYYGLDNISNNVAAPVRCFIKGNDEFVVKYYIDGEELFSETILSGNRAEQPKISQKEGYTFKGRYTEDGKTYDFSVPVTSDIELYARFEQNKSSSSNGGGGGGSSLKKDNCPDGDYSDSYYDGTCGKKKVIEDSSVMPQNDGKGSEDSPTKPQNDKTGHNSADELVYDTLRFNPHYSDEMNRAYQFAYHYGITTKTNIKDAAMNWELTRIAMAKMLSQYAVNVLGIKPDTSRDNQFADVSDKLDTEYGDGVTLAYQLGIMGINMPNNEFRPYNYVTRGEFATALSRLLYNTSDGEFEKTSKYYVPHIDKLAYEGILTNTDPYMKELRGYVMLMLMRSAK